MRRVAAAAFVAASIGCSGGETASGPTFYKHVEPLLQQNCEGCHTAGGIAPFALDSYQAAFGRLDTIAAQIEARTMPPWPPGPKGAPLLHSRALADADIETIVKWARSGGPAGNKADHKDRAPPRVTIRTDLELNLAEPYTPAANLSDDYRCFIIDPHVSQQTFVSAFDIRPAVPAQVHHVILFIALDQSDTLARLEQTDAADPGPGYQCFGGPMIEASTSGFLPPFRFLGGWAPGAGAVRLPQGTGIALPPRSKIVMQVHYNTSNGRQPDQTRAALELQPTGLKEAFLFPLADQTFTVPAGAKDVSIERPFLIPSSIGSFTIHGLFPHMHLFGTQISLDHTRAGQTVRLMDVPRWDFHWQGSYALQTPARIAAGDTLALRCLYDNSPEHQPWIDGAPQPPKPLSWGEKTTDEMCLMFLYATL